MVFLKVEIWKFENGLIFFFEEMWISFLIKNEEIIGSFMFNTTASYMFCKRFVVPY